MATICYLTAGVPLLVSLYFTSHVNLLSKLSFGATAFFLAWLVIDLMLGYKKFQPRPIQFIYLLFFMVLALCSVIFGVRTDIATTVAQLKELSGVFIWSSVFLIMYYAVDDLGGILRTLRFLDGTGIAISLSVLASFLFSFAGITIGDVQVSRLGAIRAFGPLGDQVGYVVLLFAFRSLIAKKWSMFAFHMCAILVTGTRGALVAFVVGYLVNLLIKVPLERKISSRKLLATSLVSLVMITGLVLSPVGKNALDRILNPAQLSHGLSTRTGSMYLGYLVFKDYPVTGVGFNGFRNVVWDYSPGGFFDILIGNYLVLTANQYIQTAVDGGVLGLAAFLLLFALMAINMYKAGRNEDDALALDFKSFFIWTVAILIGNQTAVWFVQHSLICHFLFLLSGLTERSLYLRERAA